MLRAIILAACSISILPAQELWNDGSWSIAAPANCGNLPVLLVNGPGSLFDSSNAAALASLEKALPAALERACPGARQAIVMSGRMRRLMRLPETPAQPASRGDLRSLASARDTEDKCEVLLGWLESGKIQGAAPVNRYRRGPQDLAIFRDEPMTAVFGMPYDKTENRWRLEQHEKVIGRCLGFSPQRPGPFNRGPNRTMQQYAQQFQQYRQVLDQAFLGTPGPYEPAAITRYLQQVREQSAWARQTMASALSAAPVRESFDRLSVDKQALSRQNLMSASEKAEVTAYLDRRQAELAPPILDRWLTDANGLPKNAASARTLHSSHARVAPVLGALDPVARSQFEGRYTALVESMIGDSLAAELAALRAIPATLPGVLELTAWQSRFEAGFRPLRGLPAVDAAEREFAVGRARVVGGALPSWLREVQAVPVDGAAITAKRREMETLFPAREDRGSPVYTQYETPLRAKEDQLRLRVEAEMRKQQQDAAAVAATQQAQLQQQARPAPPAGNAESRPRLEGPVSEGSFSAKGLTNEATLMSLYRGDFAKIGFDRDEMNFMGLYGHYLKSYGSQCDAYLPPDKVKIMARRCIEEMVTRNGFGVEVSRSCSQWETYWTKIYADPDMYDGQKQLERLAAGDALRNAGKLLTQMAGSRDPIGGALRMVGDAQALVADARSLVEINGCPSAGLKRFEQNLLRFATNKQPIRLGETGPRLSAIAPLPGVPYRDQNYARLIEDLVREHSKTWVMNRYSSGSVGGVNVVSRDAQGRPSKISAAYNYTGFSGAARGSVNVTFTDGLPECLYFFDFPASCRTPNRQVVAAYADGGYPAQ